MVAANPGAYRFPNAIPIARPHIEYTKEEALDFIISRKVLNKLEGRFEDSIKPNLEELLALLDKTYGSNKFIESKKVIRRLLKRF